MDKVKPLLMALPLLICAALVFFFSSQSYDKQSLTPFLTQHVNKTELSRLLPDVTINYGEKHIRAKQSPFAFVEFVIRKGAHLTIYALLAACGHLALRPYRLSAGSVLLIVMASVLTVAAVDEWNQTFRAYRTGMYQDVILDAAGGMIGITVCSIGFAMKDRRGKRGRNLGKKRMG